MRLSHQSYCSLLNSVSFAIKFPRREKDISKILLGLDLFDKNMLLSTSSPSVNVRLI